MKCKKCHREITENSLYCNWCGAKQIKDGNVSVPTPQRKKNGEYAGRIMVDGQRVYITAPTETEYYKRARAIKLELVDIKSTPANGKLVDIIADYISKNEVVFSPSTVRGYETIKRQLETEQRAVKDINFQKLINQLSARYKPKTVRNQWGLIQASLKAKGIPVPDVKLPPPIKTERNFLQPEEIGDFIKAIKGKKIELTALLALHSLRESEILALRKDSIRDGFIHVSGAVVPDKTNTYIRKETNKTLKSARAIPVFIPRLQQLWNSLTGEPVFPDPSNIRRDINRVCRNNALPQVGCHGLRHTFASLCYSLDIDIMTVMQLGGWSSPAVPQQIYTHLSNSRETADIKKIKKFFLP